MGMASASGDFSIRGLFPSLVGVWPWVRKRSLELLWGLWKMSDKGLFPGTYWSRSVQSFEMPAVFFVVNFQSLQFMFHIPRNPWGCLCLSR